MGDLNVDGRIILKCILSELDVRMWTGSIFRRVRSTGAAVNNNNGTSSSEKEGEFLE
jgi:hypothetical protein